MSDKPSRRKGATTSKDTESVVASMLTGTQGDKSHENRPNQGDPNLDSNQQSQGDPNLKSSNQGDGNLDSSKDQQNQRDSNNLGAPSNGGNAITNSGTSGNQTSNSGKNENQDQSTEISNNPTITLSTVEENNNTHKSNVDLAKSAEPEISEAYRKVLLGHVGATKVTDGRSLFIDLSKEDEIEETVDLSDKDAVFEKAMALTMAGDAKGAEKYLVVYKTLGQISINKNRPATVRSISANPVLVESSDKTEGVYENGMWFFSGRKSNLSRSYTPYFDRNIKELRYPIPLTIFDKDWQNKAATHNARKRSRSCDGDKDTYVGLPYADEWLLDYGEWSIHYMGFVAALKAANFTKFPEWALAHKLNVERILGSMGWMTALKYDMRIRESALVNRFEIDGKVAPPDISEYDAALAEECWGESRMRDELRFKKNPYVEGEEREGWDPATGKPPKKEKNNNNSHNNFTKSYTPKGSNPVASGSGTSGTSDGKTQEKKKFRPGYQGSNYDPDYKEKKAAAAAAAAASKANQSNK